MIENKIFKTQKEVEREERYNRIVAKYKNFRRLNPYVTKRRVMLVLADEFGYTPEGIRAILVKQNCLN